MATSSPVIFNFNIHRYDIHYIIIENTSITVITFANNDCIVNKGGFVQTFWKLKKIIIFENFAVLFTSCNFHAKCS